MSIVPPEPDSNKSPSPEPRPVSSPETAALVLEYLRENPTASVRVIAAALGIGRSTAHVAVRRLISDGSLRVVRMGTGDQYPSRYEALPATRSSDLDARLDEMARAVVWARGPHAPHPLTADVLHRYALDRKAWLLGEAPSGA